MPRSRELREPSRASKRLRASNSDAAATQAPQANQAVFKYAWKALRSEGWYSKPPRSGLDGRYRYIRPNGNPNGIEGEDFFLGEQELANFYSTTYCDGIVDLNSFEARTTSDKNQSCTTSSQTVTVGSHVEPYPWRTAARCVLDGSAQSSPADADSNAECGSGETKTPKSSNVDNIPSIDVESVICAVCHDECSTARHCSTCDSYLHHFCSHDVCVKLKLRDSEGQPIDDFGDLCYCSKHCYEERIGVGDGNLEDFASSVQTGSPIGTGEGDSISNPEIANGATQSRSRPNKWKSSRKAKKTPKKKTTPVVKAKRSRPPAKQKARPKPATPKGVTKPKVAQAYRQELSRRAKATAEKVVNANVAFSPPQEEWMKAELYRDVGAAYLSGVVTRYRIVNDKNAEGVHVPTLHFEIRWANTAFQTKHHVHEIDENTVTRGVQQYVVMQKDCVNFGESWSALWSALCGMVPKYTDIPSLTEEFEEIGEQEYSEWSKFRSRKELHIDLCPAEVESIHGMDFSPTARLEPVPGLFAHSDGTTATRLQEDSKALFGHSATRSVFAFLPISLWKQVVVFSNEYAARSGSPSNTPIELDELMKFLGILWYMALVDKGEMRNYWFDSEEADIFPGGDASNLSTVMSWRRFIYIRANLAFRGKVSAEEMNRDPAAKIRPLISMLKKRCSRHVIPGRNVAVDEASIACRSKYARHLIVFNPRKPTGKYHFKLYVCCCSTTWIVLDFKLHCSNGLADRLGDVVPNTEIARLAALTKSSSDVRKHVLEVTNSLAGSRRVVNTDNFYTSCLLLESLWTVGLYERGTVRSSSEHFPRFTMIDEKDGAARGTLKQVVCVEKHIVAASWVDGTIVNVVSNADESSTSTVYRQIKQKSEPFEPPTCIGEYNSAMQGVDRHDQLRSRFSIADGHSFKKWHKKLAMAMIDIARCNAYQCFIMASNAQSAANASPECQNTGTLRARDKHRAFVALLVKELFNGTWKESLSDHDGIMYAVRNAAASPSPRKLTSEREGNQTIIEAPVCVARESAIVLRDRSRAKRECVVCRLECRAPTQKKTNIVNSTKLLCANAPTLSTLQDRTFVRWQAGRAGKKFMNITCQVTSTVQEETCCVAPRFAKHKHPF